METVGHIIWSLWSSELMIGTRRLHSMTDDNDWLMIIWCAIANGPWSMMFMSYLKKNSNKRIFLFSAACSSCPSTWLRSGNFFLFIYYYCIWVMILHCFVFATIVTILQRSDTGPTTGATSSPQSTRQEKKKSDCRSEWYTVWYYWFGWWWLFIIRTHLAACKSLHESLARC